LVHHGINGLSTSDAKKEKIVYYFTSNIRAKSINVKCHPVIGIPTRLYMDFGASSRHGDPAVRSNSTTNFPLPRQLYRRKRQIYAKVRVFREIRGCAFFPHYAGSAEKHLSGYIFL
jgi:hypothetical protein